MSKARPGLFAEWEPQHSVLIAWPHQETDFAPILATIEQTYLEIAAAISRYQSLIVAVKDSELQTHVQQLCVTAKLKLQGITFLVADYDDIWVRDTAPLAIRSNTDTRLIAFQFNAWGAQYSAVQDSQFSQYFANKQVFNATLTHCDLTIEGGAFDSNGCGTVLSTASCLYDTRRNTIDKESIEQTLGEHLLIDRLIVLKHGKLIGDDTGGHVDTLARFCSTDTIAYTSCNDPEDEHYSELNKMRAELQQLRTEQGEPYVLIALPIPAPVKDDSGQRLPANYANFLIINGAVLIPQYDDPADQFAIQQLKLCFADRELIPIQCKALVTQFGSIHCMSMNYPASINNASS